MQPRGRAGGCYVVLAMLAAAAAGRAVDGGALLPGVTEPVAVRGAGAAWVVALAGAGLLGVLTAATWRRTRSIRAIAYRVVAGQGAVFLAGEAAARIARGQGPLDPDGLLGAALQAALALALLSVLATGWAVVRAVAPADLLGVPVLSRERPGLLVVLLPKATQGGRSARAPPRSACTSAA